MTHHDDRIPRREEVPVEHQWDLGALFSGDEDWETALQAFAARSDTLDAYKGRLGSSPACLREAVDQWESMERLEERLGCYAHLRVCEDLGHSDAQGRLARYESVATAFHARTSFMTPEIQRIPDEQIHAWLEEEVLAPYRVWIERLLRFKPHVLSEAEERLLALQAEANQTARNGFKALTDVDMEFGQVETAEGLRPLTHSTFATFLQDPDRAIREQAYTRYLQEFHAHRHTLAALYNGSVQLDVYRARVRQYPSAREAALFAHHIPVSVYDNLIEAVHDALPVLHRYYDIRRRALQVDVLRLYDTRVPLVPDIQTHYSYDEAVDIVLRSLEPLGSSYQEPLRAGLTGRWVDRYENKGKRSGAFSSVSYAGDPYILMNYQADVLSDLFTLTHEAGHSMHSWFSVRSQPFTYYAYTIFVAEVASTFNEQLLARYLMEQTDDPAMRAYLLNKQVDDLVATLFRQTMFAEFERDAHAMVERNEPLTVDSMTRAYAALITRYFGPDIPQETHSALEGLRIPHFYSAFYVFQYATGIAAALSLSEHVLNGGEQERHRYLAFLQSGGSQYPLDQLRDAGVDMTDPAPVQTALQRFESLVNELENTMCASLPGTALK